MSSWFVELVGAVASLAMVGQMLSGSFVCRDIVKAGSTANVPPFMFVLGTALAGPMFAYADIVGDPAMVRSNWAGLLLNIGYLLCYWIYCDDRPSLYKLCRWAALVSGALVLYARWEDPELVEFRFGIIMTVILFTLVGLPMLEVPDVIRTGCSARIQMPMVVSGVMVSSIWLFYGFLIGNGFMKFQNFIILTLSAFQLWLCLKYPRTPVAVKKH